MTKSELALEIKRAAQVIRNAAKSTELLEEIVSEELVEMDVEGQSLSNPHQYIAGRLKHAAEELGDVVAVLQAAGMFGILDYSEPGSRPVQQRKPFKTIKEQAAEARATGKEHHTVVKPAPVPMGDAAHPWR